jgi:quercetin dioxygenase-like cupin family protein
MHLEQVALIVDDCDEAITFSVGALGFDLVEDAPAVTSSSTCPATGGTYWDHGRDRHGIAVVFRSRLRQTRSPSEAPGRTFSVYRLSRRLPMPDSDTGERVTDVLNLPSRDGLVVNAVRVDYEPGGFSRVHRHPAGAYVYVIDGSVVFGVDDREPVVLKAGDSFYEPPDALHSVSRNASQELPASLIAFFVLDEGQSPTVYHRD